MSQNGGELMSCDPSMSALRAALLPVPFLGSKRKMTNDMNYRQLKTYSNSISGNSSFIPC